jgi:sulfate adenylyltransferase
MVRDGARRSALIAACDHSQECSDRNACDVELLAVGGFSPLEGFMSADVYDHVVKNMRWGGGSAFGSFAFK